MVVVTRSLIRIFSKRLKQCIHITGTGLFWMRLTISEIAQLKLAKLHVVCEATADGASLELRFKTISLNFTLCWNSSGLKHFLTIDGGPGTLRDHRLWKRDSGQYIRYSGRLCLQKIKQAWIKTEKL